VELVTKRRQTIHVTRSDLKFWHYWIFPAAVVIRLVTFPTISYAQEITDCKAATNYLNDAVDNANYCRQAEECGTLRFEEDRSVGCGLLFNKAEQSTVESAIETYARLCGPYWHCRAWAITHEVGCTRNRCEWLETSGPNIEDLKTRDSKSGLKSPLTNR